MADKNLVRRGAPGGAAETGGMIVEEPLEHVSPNRLAQDLEAGGGSGEHAAHANDDGPTKDDGDETQPLSIDRRYAEERMAAKVRNWREGELAAGLVELTWRDELSKHRYTDDDEDDANGANRGVCADCCKEEMEPTCGCLYLSGLVCSRLGAGRVGNMAILKESTIIVEEEIHDADDEEEGIESEHDSSRTAPSSNGSAAAGGGNGAIRTRRVHRRKIDFVVGPYWPMLLCITYPLIFAVSTWTFVSAILPGRHPLVTLVWATLTLGLIYALFGVAFRDPGILPRHRTPPVGSGRGEWRWNDQAQTYRPRGSIYDPDCAVVIEDFDHTCPWTVRVWSECIPVSKSWICARVGIYIVSSTVCLFLLLSLLHTSIRVRE